MLKKVLIANRGEVAVRIARACTELGIASVAVVSDADTDGMHSRWADEVVHIGPAPAPDSYLRGDHIIEVALSRGCDAIHPGYGFLSQSAEFADAVSAAGLVFVGPPGSAMRVMGNKTAAREAMLAAGVPVVPGYQGTGDESLETLSKEADRVGYPLLVKAAAGGGGKGMRIVRSADGLSDALESARHEAVKAFGDGRLFIERFVEQAHHIEVQILADTHGTTLHLFERECSIQRRYQKIIEESPSPLLDDALRDTICQTAVDAARACGYVNAGTVEMLVSAEDRSYFFLEMNTRLQVEHPVTEEVTGIDIVAEQLRVAAGDPLSFAQDELTQRGHAIECRLYAEDPAAGFAPSTGTAHLVHFPSGPGVRVDAGVESGDDISVYYDPMIAKVVTRAPSRAAAIARMRAALGHTAVLGVETNREFLLTVLEQPAFEDGSATTTWVEQTLGDWAPHQAETTPVVLIAAALGGSQYAESPAGPNTHSATPGSRDPWRIGDGFRPGGPRR